MTDRIAVNGLSVDSDLYSLVVEEILPGTGVAADHFWEQLEQIASYAVALYWYIGKHSIVAKKKKNQPI